jgi:hypothetical protein
MIFFDMEELCSKTTATPDAVPSIFLMTMDQQCAALFRFGS